MNLINNSLLAGMVSLLAAASWHAPLGAQVIDGFTIPFRTIELAFDETGTILELYVQEGDHVAAGAPIARLDDRVQQLQLELSQHLANSYAAVKVAQRTLEKRRQIVESLQRLRGNGHAAENELIRAELELAIAESRYLAAQEEVVARDIDRRRAAIMLERRTLRAPFSGVVTRIHRNQGEYVSPMQPEIVTLVDVSKMFAVFNVSGAIAETLKLGQEARISFPSRGQVAGKIHYIGVETDAQSGTIQVKVILDNSSAEWRAGEQCWLNLD